MTKYTKFFAMILTSTAFMLVMMYFNSYSIEHVFFSETRLYMAIYMGAMMAVIMLLFMLPMYESKIKNVSILIGSVVIFCLALFLVRSQATIEGRAWMKAMIPHHSIAILTSERANIDDVRVQKLAEEIINAQEREIKEMKWLISDINKNGIVSSANEAIQRPVPDFSKK
ncbi:DUF305 domain-containing protein [Alteromonas sp. MB-3u-76]|jgi:magnesium-transporting ATPase (P-type)|uniref:DUF305 domain-containing protein n=1 Tax=unclassified Alteromonas TaxID=2614992 RepID=UPI000904489B|nr:MULTISPECIES: DUF305 domain-containing protein [unclassified Alteromonas]APE06367.1 DUF305 domain-containing protein [Alteromonas sp. RW2A1]AUC88272.1 DUF305 domain-containing protein [Alteromonas sp. MB-3u-76]